MGLGKLDGRRLLLLGLLATVPLACGGEATPASGSSTGGAASEAVGGAGGAGGAGVGKEASAGSRSYACLGGFVYEAIGGARAAAGAGGAVDYGNFEDVPWTGGVGGESSCVVSQAYCAITSVPYVQVGVPPTSRCVSLSGRPRVLLH
jgi:hypothetical protein